MWSRLLALAFLLLSAPALADVKEDVAALAPSALVLVMDAAGNELVAQNTDKPFVPASVTKIVTAWLAMEVLGGDYRFETRFYLDDKRVLYVRGGGDRAGRRDRQQADCRHRAGRELLSFEPAHPGHREHR
jgi:D-alanyl-D-alanine carboxypeptidase/D-alanyl-D-alanine-endopeptidase (penicillin-binding protein 4)